MGHVDRPMLEREREIARVDRLLDGLAAGDSAVLVVEGPAGIGKSRVLAEVRSCARNREVRVLAARGGDLERDFPFGVVRSLFEPVLSRGDDAALMDGAAAAARPVFTPAGADADGAEGMFAALHGLYWLTVNLAEGGPLAVVVDDLHACDVPSLRFLAYLCGRMEGLGVLLAAGVRSGDPGTDPVLLARLTADPDTVVLRPRPLGEDGVAALVGAALDGESDPAFTAACRDVTGGNPLLLGILLGSLSDDNVAPSAGNVAEIPRVGARGVSRTVLSRLARLPPEATAVARALAVLGDGARPAAVAALAGVDGAAVAPAIAALAGADVLHPEPPAGFVHPLVRDAVYHDIPVGERELHHSRAARALAEAGAPDEEVAAQLLAAPHGGDPWLVEVLVRAAAGARTRGAADTAVAHLARALDEPPHPDRHHDVLVELGMTAAGVDGPLAARVLAPAWEGIPDPEVRAAVGGVLAECLLFTAAPDEAVAVAQAAARHAPSHTTDLRRRLEAVAHLAVTFGARVEAVPRGPAHGAARDEAGAGTRFLTAVAAWDLALTGGTAADSARLALDALEDGALVAAGDAVAVGTALGALVLAEHPEALTAINALEAVGYRRGSHFAVSTAQYFRGGVWLRRGELPDAEAALRGAMDVARLWGDVTWEVPELARAAIERGDLAGARALLGEAHSHADRSVPAHGMRRARAELLLAEGRPVDALVAADEYTDGLGRITGPAFAPWRSLTALALDACGRTADAVALAEQEVPPARTWGSPGVTGRALRVLGTLRREEGLDVLREAVAVLEGSGARLELARALAALGSAMRRSGRRAESRDPLARALELANRCGAAGLAERVRTELHAAGSRPRTAAPSGPDALTPSERRVAELAAEGRSNKEIAQALYITLKTVEVHLSHAYQKLGIGSRRGLAAALTDR